MICCLFAAAVLTTALAQRWVITHPTPAADNPEDFIKKDEPLPGIGSTQGLPVSFSLDCGFWQSGEKLYLSANNAVKILYTKDGSDPQTNGKPYKDGITLKPDPNSDCTPFTIKACAQYQDGSFSETVARSYFIDSDIAERFDCLVFSISIDPDKLYNYEDGIFILGKMRDDYLATNPTKEIQPTDPANWNQRGMAGEREAYLEVFEYDGNCVISQSCGMRIFGGWSRANDQKNIRLFARSEYDSENDRFRYEFFPDAVDSNGDKLKSAKKLALRACANDNGALFARDDTISYLAMAADIDAKHSRPAAVFLNGEYYGFAWCQEVFSSDWLDHKYNVSDGKWDIIKGCEYMIKDDPDEDISRAKADWEHMYSYAYKDLTDDNVFAELEKLIDIDNFLTYYALNSYVGNGDWPNNNYKAYRYVSGDASDSQRHDRLDSRWRFMLYDTDFALGLYGNDFLDRHIGYLLDEEYFGRMPLDWDLDVHDDGEKYRRSDLLIAMCKRDDIRERFAGIVLDMMNWYFEAQRVSDKLDYMHTLRLHELAAAANQGTCSAWSVDSELKTAKNWITKRPYAAKKQLSQCFPDAYSFDEIFKINVDPTNHAVITVNSAIISPEESYVFSGEYFIGMNIPVSVSVDSGYRFDYWLINGEKVTDPSPVIKSEEYGKKVDLKLVVSCVSAGIDISEVSYKGSNDYIVLKNYSDSTLSTKGLTISDKKDGSAFVIPAADIKPGASVKLVCKNYSRSDAYGCIECGFSLSEGETLTLTKDGKPVRTLLLRDAAKNSALKLDTHTGRYIAFTPYPKARLLEAELPEFKWGGWGDWGGWGW